MFGYKENGHMNFFLFDSSPLPEHRQTTIKSPASEREELAGFAGSSVGVPLQMFDKNPPHPPKKTECSYSGAEGQRWSEPKLTWGQHSQNKRTTISSIGRIGSASRPSLPALLKRMNKL